ncbi:twin-arginine translocase subunit TatC [Halobaculum halobium]|uniref:Sec-independent protein translocase protein TatC n=2 Tax=Halobaculum halobium TaxID=3032281 RepID=A0ABD5TBM6_9EURY|nr:twin-arginine translocase subunit TatC [Halobaculum sp. SYNS20]
MTADSDPPDEPSAEADGDRDAETVESAEPPEPAESDGDPAHDGADTDADDAPDDADANPADTEDDRDAGPDPNDGDSGDDDGADEDGDTDGDTSAEDGESSEGRTTDEELGIDRRSPFEDGDNGDGVSSDGDGGLDSDDDLDDDSGNSGDGDSGSGDDGDGDGDGGVERDSLEPTPIAGDTQEIDGSQPVPDAVAGERTGEGGAPAASGETAAASGEGAATNGGGAMTAAQKGMDAVNKGVGALGGEGGGPESDQEMPLAAHIEEMMRRLGLVFGIAGVVVVAVLLIGTVSPTVPSAEQIIEFLWDAHVGFEQNRPRVYGPLEFLLTKLKVASLAGLLVGLPVFVYETYRFMRPGLYPHERRYYLAAVPTSLILGIIGVAFAHFIVLPVIFDYFISYTEGSAELAFSLKETFNLILLLMGYMAIVFQIPLFIQLAIMMGLVTREWMEDRRLLFWSGFVGLAFIVSPDPTGMAPIIVGATMIVLFEGTLALLRWTGN